MKFTKIKETCLYVSDLDKCSEFYHGKLGLPIISRSDGRHIFFRAGESVLLCFIAEATKVDTRLPPHYGHGSLHMAFEVAVDNYEATMNEFHQLGIPITHEETWENGTKSFYFEDPDGNVLEVVQIGMWGD
ncbi:MAG: VOC family protein [Cyclobacteriaceae bacterium]